MAGIASGRRDGSAPARLLGARLLPTVVVLPRRGRGRRARRNAKIYALALGRAAISACHLAMLPYPAGTASLAGFMKSIAIIAVMSATE